MATPELHDTVDPSIKIEGDRQDGLVVYRNVDSGERWMVEGICDRRGDCIIGAIATAPDGSQVSFTDKAAIALARERFGTYFVNAQIDAPITPAFDSCCPFKITVLDPV